jgi:hypothetical protein
MRKRAGGGAGLNRQMQKFRAEIERKVRELSDDVKL